MSKKDLYEGCFITNIHRGKGDKNHMVFAELRNSQGKMLVAGTVLYLLDIVTMSLKTEE